MNTTKYDRASQMARYDLGGILRTLIASGSFPKPKPGCVYMGVALSREEERLQPHIAAGRRIDFGITWVEADVDDLHNYPHDFAMFPLMAGVMHMTFARRRGPGPWYRAILRHTTGEVEASIPVLGGELVLHDVTSSDVARALSEGSITMRGYSA